MKFLKHPFLHLVALLAGALILRFIFDKFMEETYGFLIRLGAVFFVLSFGAFFVLKGTARIIEETTGVLSHRTQLAGGMLQSLGTAFPDMILGIVAAIASLRVVATDYTLAVNFAIIAAATTFGSNIYNIGHAVWCIFRQNMANRKKQSVFMFPYLKKAGIVTPINEHELKPDLIEFDTAIDVLNVLSLLTAAVAISMVFFGQVAPPTNISGDLYQMVKPAALIILLLASLSIYFFRKTTKEEHRLSQEEEEIYYQKKSNAIIILYLLFSGLAILLAAEVMVGAVRVLSEITGMPFVVTGVLAGIIGCLGEMIVIHNFTINPKGRLGDAVVGVAMDNIVTLIGASIVALMGGIFLGGNALILIFVVILALNTMLIWQISRLKNYFLESKT